MSWQKVKLKEVLIQIKDSVLIDNTKEYKLVTVSNKGVIKLREIVKGVEISANKAFVTKKGQFIYSRLSIHNGAFGIIPTELNGALVTSEMPLFEFKDIIIPDFFIYSLMNNTFKFQLEQLTKGVGRTRVKENSFLDLVIDLPSIEIQNLIVSKIKSLENEGKNISNELTHQLDLIKQLRQAFLREAMQGKLCHAELVSASQETGHELLAKIKAEKAQLIAEKKLKKEKELPPITEDEIPFEIPEHWAWCRGNDLATYIDPQPSHRTPPESKEGIPYVAMSDIKKDGTIDFSSTRKVSLSVLEEHKNRYVLEEGDFIFGKIGTLGKPVLLPKPFEYTLSANVILIQANRKIIRDDYLFYFLGSPIAEKELLDKKSTTSYPVFGMAKARNMIIPLPPLHEQEQIVAKLEELMAFCDGLEQSIKESQGYNEQLLQQVLREALQGKEV
jgi:type I restriction enzyme S subunit